MYSEETMQKWIFRIRMTDGVGALTSAVSVFSNTGLDITSAAAYRGEEKAKTPPQAIVVCECSAADKEIALRRLKRCNKVIDVKVSPFTVQDVCKTVIFTVSRELTHAETTGMSLVSIREIREWDVAAYTYCAAGHPMKMDILLEALAVEGVLRDAAQSCIAL